MQFSNDNVTYSTAQTYATSKSWTLTTGNGTKTVWARFKDTPGNWSTPYSDTILLDTTAPTTTAAPPGGTYNSAQSVTLTCTDTGDSGCDKIYYTTNGTTPTTSSPVYSSPVNISATTTLKFFAKDLAGNSEAVKTQTYTMDTTLPTGTVSINSAAASTISTNVTLTLSCTDTNGCSQMQFSNDNVITLRRNHATKSRALTTVMAPKPLCQPRYRRTGPIIQRYDPLDATHQPVQLPSTGAAHQQHQRDALPAAIPMGARKCSFQ
jgi:hypothetical protein